MSTRVSVALPVRNGAETVGAVIESVLGQTRGDLELVVSDNASTDGTEDVCRGYARADPRVVYLRQPTDIGLLANFTAAARAATGTHLRWIGDDDELAPGYVEAVSGAFAEDPARALVTTPIVYLAPDGTQTLDTAHDPAPLASPDPVARFAAMLQLLTSGFAVLDPLYATMRRELAVRPRRGMLREDEVFAAELALAGPWGHVAEPLARRRRPEVDLGRVARLMGVPGWHARVIDVRQCRELLRRVEHAPLTPEQRRRARREVLALYGRLKRNHARRGVAKAERLVGVGA